MGKTKETLRLEEALHIHTKEKRIYGVEEVTIGFYNAGMGKEIVDYMTMDSKGILRCYEIKVSKNDLVSKAKKSWYGHYNYLVVSDTLFHELPDLQSYIPADIGILVGTRLECTKKPKKHQISIDCAAMLKESMVRSIYFKMEKYKSMVDKEKQRENERRYRKIAKENAMYRTRAERAEHIIRMYENFRTRNTGNKVDLEKEAEKEKAIYLKKRIERKL